MARVFTVHTPLGPETLKFHLLTGQEYLSRPFDFELSMLSPSPALAMDSLLGRGVTVEVETQGQGRRYLHGEVARFTLIGRHGRYYRYTARVVPWLWYLTRAADFRIFQNKSVPQILDEVFAAYPYSWEKRLTGHYREWEYCVQYHETDFNFVSRLMEHEGIYYFFEHAMGQLKLVLADSIGAHVSLPGHASIPYISPDAATIADEEHVRSWMISKEVTSGGYITDDYDFKRPHAELRQWKIDPKAHPNAEWRTYDFPGGYTDLGDGQNYTKVRLEELQSPYELLQGDTTVRALAPGYLFSLYRCPRADQNREYLIVSANYYLKDNPYETFDADEGTVWQITFACQESAVQFRPPRMTPKPLASGPESATVVGPPGEEIYTDEYGRVKVQFHWDQYGKYDENSSCWIRVSHPWAGTGYGAMFMPRIRQEVIVDFLGGDPDCPLITGRVYNAEQKVPYELPKYSAYSTLKSRSTKYGGVYDGNEMRFDDRKDKEQLFLLAQRRMDVRVKRSKYETVRGSRHTQVGGDEFHTTHGEYNLHVHGKGYQAFDADYNLYVKGDIKVGTPKDIRMGAVRIEANARRLVLDGGAEIVLRVNNNFVRIDASGITIQGALTRINSGGGAAPVPMLDVEGPLDAGEADDGTPGCLDRRRAAYKGGGGRGRTTWLVYNGSGLDLGGGHTVLVARNGDGSVSVGSATTIKPSADDPHFTDKVLDDLGAISSTPAGRTRLNNIENSGRTMNIERIPNGANATVHNANDADAAAPGIQSFDHGSGTAGPGTGRGSDTTVKYNPDWEPQTTGPGGPASPISPTQTVPSDSTLFHEMGHAENAAAGRQNSTGIPAEVDGRQFDNIEEKNVTNSENQYRQERGIPQRFDHHNM